MRKFIITLAVLAMSAFAVNAEEKTKTYDFGDIRSLNIGYNYQVHVTEGNSDEVKVVYDSKFEGYMQISYSSETHRLSISMKDNLPKNLRVGNQPRINVYLEMDDMVKLDISGAASVTFEGEFRSRDLDIDLSGASKGSVTGNFTEEVELDLSGASKFSYTGNSNSLSTEISGASKFTFAGDFRETDIRCSGASSAQMEGSSDSAEYECSGASRIEAKEFVVKDLKTVLSGASRAEVHATSSLIYSASRSCKITYYGDAVHKNISPDSNVVRGI